MSPDEIIVRLGKQDPVAEHEFIRWSKEDPTMCGEVSEMFFLSNIACDQPAICILVMRGFVLACGRAHVESYILSRWATLHGLLRRKIAYCASDQYAMSTEFAETLFRHHESRVDERHLIVAGLASSARERRSGKVVLQLLPDVGKYEIGGTL